MQEQGLEPHKLQDSEEDLSDLRFARTQNYFNKSVAVRFLITLLFTITLFFFLHFREVYTEKFELGSAAKRYVVTQVDFSFPDEEATLFLKQEAATDVGSIYAIDDAEIRRDIAGFQKYILIDEKGSRQWQEIVEEVGLEQIAEALGLLSDGLKHARFTDLHTLKEISTLPIAEQPRSLTSYFVFLPSVDNESVKLPSGFWRSLFQRIDTRHALSSDVIRFLVRYFENIAWTLHRDQTTEHTLQKLMQAKIPEKRTEIRAGERIIDQGETISGRHMAMVQSMKVAISNARHLLDPITIAGSLLLTFIFVVLGGIYLHEHHASIFYSNRKLCLLISVLLLDFIFAKVTELFLLHSTANILDYIRFPLFVPFAALLISNLINVRIAAFATVFLSLVFSMSLAVEPIPFLVVNLFAGMVVILSTRAIRRRKEVFIACGKAWIATVLVILAYNLYGNTAFSLSLVSDLCSTFIFMLFTAVLVVGFLPVLESLFQIMTDITLMEFMDPNHELLRRLIIEAPGTYQHSVIVGNLAEAAASAIGANSVFCRVATLYHDVGKLANPQYFTENQLSGVDMHQLLTPFESAQVIIAHVSEGVALARKLGLPEQFIDVIKEHHGTTLVYYFYHKQLALAGNERDKIVERDFRYFGPKPRSKESTLIMIADTLEAASRSLDSFTEETITNLVESLITQKAADGQFDESLLTFEELGLVKQILIKTLLAASHPRIKYPPHHVGEEG